MYRHLTRKHMKKDQNKWQRSSSDCVQRERPRQHGDKTYESFSKTLLFFRIGYLEGSQSPSVLCTGRKWFTCFLLVTTYMLLLKNILMQDMDMTWHWICCRQFTTQTWVCVRWRHVCDMFVCFYLSGGVVLLVQRTDHQSNQRRFMSNHTVPLKSFRKWCKRIKSYRIVGWISCFVSWD